MKNYKRLISLFLAIILSVSSTSVNIPSYAEEGQSQTRQPTLVPITEEPDIDLTVEDNPIMLGDIINTARLTKIGKYSKLSTDEKEIVCEYYHLESSVFAACEQLGYSIIDSVRIGRAAIKAELTPAEYKCYVEAFGSEDAANSQLNVYNRRKAKFTTSRQSEIKELMQKGYEFKDVLFTTYVATELSCDISDIIAPRNDEISASSTATLVTGEKNAYAVSDGYIAFCKRYNLDPVKFSQVVEEKNGELAKFVSTFNAKNSLSASKADTNSNQTRSSSEEKVPKPSLNHETVNAPSIYYAGTNEQVNASTGGFTFRETLVDLKGRNGMDLKLDLVFNSNSNLYYGYDPSASYDNVRDWYTKYPSELGEYDTYYRQRPIENFLGIGWSFDMPSITSIYEYSNPDNFFSDRVRVDYYNMPNGGRYKISGNTLVGYDKNDVTIQTISSTYYYDGNYSHWKVTYANGNYEIYDCIGQIREKGDKYGNKLVYEYYSVDPDAPDNDGRLYTITDNTGRCICFRYYYSASYNEMTVSVTVTDNTNKALRTEYVFFADQCQVRGSDGDWDTLDGIYILTGYTDGLKDKNFGYNVEYVTATDQKHMGSINSVNGENRVINMTSIEYKSGLKSYYDYEKAIVNNGQYGIKEMFRVKSRSETQEYNYQSDSSDFLEILKDVYYTYTGDYSGYSTRAVQSTEANKKLYADPNNLPASYTYKVTKSENGLLTETTYNNKQLPTQIRAIDAVEDEVLSVSTTTYDQYECPIVQTTTVGQITTTEKFENDQYGNVIKHWSAKAGGQANPEYLTQYTYDTGAGKYNMLTGKTYKRDADTTVTESYTLTSDNKSVATKTVSENGTVKERTDYAYDAYGNVSQEKRYKTANTYITTNYDYTDTPNAARETTIYEILTSSNGDYTDRDITVDMSGVLPTKVWQNGGQDIDGTDIGTVQTTYLYDIAGNPLRTTDAMGKSTSMTYDIYHRVTKITNPQSKTQQFVYKVSETENSTTITDELGKQYKYMYDGASNLIDVLDVETGTSLNSYDYNTYYQLIAERNAQLANSGNQVNYTYDVLGRVTVKETKDTSGTTVAKDTYSYDDASFSPYMVTTHTIVGGTWDPSIITNEYVNAYGEVEKIGQVTEDDEFFTTYTYDYLGSPLTERSAVADQKNWDNEYTTKWEYDYAGRVLREYNAIDDYVSYEYDMLGRKVRFYDAVANKQTTPYYTSYQYDDLGNLICETVPQTATTDRVTKYKYDKLGRTTLEKQLYDVTSAGEVYHSAEYTYDWRGNILTSTKGDLTTTNTYDNLGRLLTTATGGKTVTYTYDRFGNVLTVESGGETDTYQYDMNGFNTKHIKKDGTALTYTPTALSQVASIWTSNSGARSMVYGMTGNITEMNASSGTVHLLYWFNDLGQMTQESQTGANKYYTYDIAGKRETFTTKVLNTTQQEMTYTYNTLEQLCEVYEDGDQIVEYIYDANGNVTEEFKGAVISVETEYNRDNSVAEIFTPTMPMTGSESRRYTYYLNGNVKSETDIEDNVTKTYTYNARDMLASEALSTGKVTAYTYDTKGNRATKTDTQNGISAVTTYTYDGMNRLTSEATSDNVGLLASAYYVYDDNGNLILRSRETVAEGTAQNQTSLSGGSPTVDTFEYNEYGNMTSATVNGVTTTYTYRPDNLREKKIVNGVTTRHVWDMGNIAMDLDGNYGIVGEYTRGVGLIGCYIPGQGDMFYFHNRHGDVTQVVNDYMMTGTSYDYDAYGNQAEITATDTNPFRYSGEYYDSETGFIYLRNRYYDTTTGRFTTEDPVRDGLNWYSYCAGNPLKYLDPSGMEYAGLRELVASYHMLFSGDVDIQLGEDINGDGFAAVTIGEYYRAFYYDGTIVDREYEAHGGLVYEKKNKVADNKNGKLYMQRSDFVKAMGMLEDSNASVKTSAVFDVTATVAAADFISTLNGSIEDGGDVSGVLEMLGTKSFLAKSAGNIVSTALIGKKLKEGSLLSKGQYQAEVVTVHNPKKNRYYYQVITLYAAGTNTSQYQWYFTHLYYDGIPLGEFRVDSN